MAYLPWEEFVALVEGDGGAAAYIMSIFCERVGFLFVFRNSV